MERHKKGQGAESLFGKEFHAWPNVFDDGGREEVGPEAIVFTTVNDACAMSEGVLEMSLDFGDTFAVVQRSEVCLSVPDGTGRERFLQPYSQGLRKFVQDGYMDIDAVCADTGLSG